MIKCMKCGTSNKDEAVFCRKCGMKLKIEPLWRPTWKWHLTVLGIIYVVLIVIFFIVNWLLKPYMRKLPQEITPWLKSTK